MPYKETVRQLISRPALQPLWSRLLKLCHAGMNYGGGQATHNSGEIGALKFAATLLPPAEPLLIFDVGAHQGEYVEAALDALAGRNAQIYSFEPLPSNFVELQALCSPRANIHTRNAALGAQSGTMELFIAREGITTASLHASKAGESGQSVAVEITTVDEVCADAGLTYISFLKIDTEGHEIDVLQGASKLIEAGGVRAIQFEFGDTFLLTDHHFQDVFLMLAPQYTIYRILRAGLSEIREYHHDLEIYKLANFLCIHKSLAR
jgi:FkbM family methyltransferase